MRQSPDNKDRQETISNLRRTGDTEKRQAAQAVQLYHNLRKVVRNTSRASFRKDSLHHQREKNGYNHLDTRGDENIL